MNMPIAGQFVACFSTGPSTAAAKAVRVTQTAAHSARLRPVMRFTEIFSPPPL